ncbi:MAG: PAS domain S-box protein [Chloroflexota bacterium]|nr:PAS domain S-box protein [Chloroflexota bacterium]
MTRPAKDALRDPERLAALRRTALLDPSADTAFDRLTRLATRVMGVPVALVVLVDADRQVFKGCVGLPEPWASRREAPLSHSFCKHIVTSTAPLVVEDARIHPLVCDNLAVPELGVVAYAGIPLTTDDGHVLGTFCAIDHEPRNWSEAELTTLADLTTAAVTEVELRLAAAEAKSALAALGERETQLRLAVEAADLGTWTLNPATGAMTGSARCKAHHGLPTDAPFSSQELLAAIHPDDRPDVEAAVRRSVETGVYYASEYRAVWPDSSVRWIAATGRLVADPEGRPGRMTGVTADVTERRQAEEALRASEERYRTLFASIDEGFCVVEVLFDTESRPVDYRFLEANPAFERHTGLRGVVGRRMRELAPDHEARWFAIYGQVAVTGEPVRFENEARALGGRTFDVYAFRLGAPARRQVATLFTDVTGRRRAEADQARLAAIVESSWDAIVGRDLDGTITSWNPGAEALYGYTAEEIVGQPISRLLPPGYEGELAELTAHLGCGERIPPFDTVRVSKDGTPVEVEMTVSPIADDAGRILGVAAVARDIRQRRAAERQQQEFLEAIAHDLKNPLTFVWGQAQLLARRARKGQLKPEALVDALGAIAAAARRMGAQIDELQDAARLRAGQPLELQTALVDLVALAGSAVAEAQAATRRHTVRLEAPEPRLVGLWDALRLRRVIDNLLGNALKYSEGGEIVVAVWEECRRTGHRAVLAVRDEGVGIPAADLPHVFEHYRRGSNVGTHRHGTGIGLSGTRRIVEQHGGTITVTSEEGRGSVFTVELPLSRPARPADESDCLSDTPEPH